jgi:hypothetical protein
MKQKNYIKEGSYKRLILSPLAAHMQGTSTAHTSKGQEPHHQIPMLLPEYLTKQTT